MSLAVNVSLNALLSRQVSGRVRGHGILVLDAANCRATKGKVGAKRSITGSLKCAGGFYAGS